MVTGWGGVLVSPDTMLVSLVWDAVCSRQVHPHSHGADPYTGVGWAGGRGSSCGLVSAVGGAVAQGAGPPHAAVSTRAPRQ